ncbi:jg17497, partial [Pararge aegeria aegeria]
YVPPVNNPSKNAPPPYYTLRNTNHHPPSTSVTSPSSSSSSRPYTSPPTSSPSSNNSAQPQLRATPKAKDLEAGPQQTQKIKFRPLLSNRKHVLQQKSMETVYQREVEISPGPRSSVMKERP